ncbi:MAG: hypothetical protein GWN00_26865 [Aliifodinibius sp.]|nr:hypothetical protein [Phycisphaerae bacterium]NIR66002.1 hypothetical protein [candidate division Zixibacteria bacterium]NIT59710.1 hypothetical protein [Fodinibius sp.]NIW47162.1 hypothetical protein [Gammaproteobacteria bacterium]NIS53522.1 hypothetical protein [Phycisphaerae bacterium]
MARWQNDTMLDQALTWIKTNTDNIHICTSQPTTFSQATSTYELGQASLAVSGSPANGSSSGRKIAIDAASSIAITSSGTMKHVALTGKVSSVDTLLYVTTIPASSQSTVSASDKVNAATWNITLKDASA